jgi:hypothetical protein
LNVIFTTQLSRAMDLGALEKVAEESLVEKERMKKPRGRA